MLIKQLNYHMKVIRSPLYFILSLSLIQICCKNTLRTSDNHCLALSGLIFYHPFPLNKVDSMDGSSYHTRLIVSIECPFWIHSKVIASSIPVLDSNLDQQASMHACMHKKEREGRIDPSYQTCQSTCSYTTYCNVIDS